MAAAAQTGKARRSTYKGLAAQTIWIEVGAVGVCRPTRPKPPPAVGPWGFGRAGEGGTPSVEKKEIQEGGPG